MIAVDLCSGIDRAAVPREVSDALYDAVMRASGCTSLLDLRPFRRHRHIRADGPPPGTLELPLLANPPRTTSWRAATEEGA